jgi:hypothetical protein
MPGPEVKFKCKNKSPLKAGSNAGEVSKDYGI